MKLCLLSLIDSNLFFTAWSLFSSLEISVIEAPCSANLIAIDFPIP